MQAPGSEYYKVLIVSFFWLYVNYCFTLTDIGDFAFGVLSNSAFGIALESGSLSLPASDNNKPGIVSQVPYFLLAMLHFF